MQTPRTRLTQIRLRSPWAWLLAIPLLVLAFVMAIVFFLVVLVSGSVAALFGRSKRQPPQPGRSKIIDVEYVIESDPGKK